MTIMTMQREIVVGVDTHLDVHVAVALDAAGARLGDTTPPVSERCYEALRTCVQGLGEVRAVAVEGPVATAPACPLSAGCGHRRARGQPARTG